MIWRWILRKAPTYLIVPEVASRVGDGCAVEVAGWRIQADRISYGDGAAALHALRTAVDRVADQIVLTEQARP